jgi:Swt1-like HEPN
LSNQKITVASPMSRPDALDYVLKIPETSAILFQTSSYWDQNKHLFQRPDVLQLNDLAKSALAMRTDYVSITDTVTAMGRIQSPWLDTRNPVVSVGSFASIQQMGVGINTTPFASAFTGSLRDQLGDWRGVTHVPAGVLTDPVARTQFYLERGFRAELIDFPPDALDEILDKAGLSASEDGEFLLWQDRASPYIRRIEHALRIFVNEIMTAAFGDDWTKRLQPDTINRWKGTKLKRAAEGRPELPHLIHYSELSDLQEVMQRGDHFPHFKPAFKRVESMQEMFRRVLPARHAVAHVGVVTPIDYITVLAEYGRLRQAIAKKN